MLERAVTAVLLSVLMILSGSFVVAHASPAAAAAKPKTYRIMPLGDSITRGGGQTSGQYLGYRLALQKQLKTGTFGVKFDFVGSMNDKGVPDGNHEGHGGWTIDQLSAHIDRWMVTYRPDIVLLHAGTNNITLKDSPAVTAAKLGKLIAKIRSRNANTKIFVAKVIKSRDPARQARTNTYESLIPAVVAASGPNVYLVNQSTVGATDLYDWTHPNEFGYLKMAYNWYQALNTVLGGGDWWPMVSPYRAKTATICQIHYSIGAKRVCRKSLVN